MAQFRAVTEKEISKFEKDGIICLRGLFEAKWVDRMREAAEGTDKLTNICGKSGKLDVVSVVNFSCCGS